MVIVTSITLTSHSKKKWCRARMGAILKYMSFVLKKKVNIFVSVKWLIYKSGQYGRTDEHYTEKKELIIFGNRMHLV